MQSQIGVRLFRVGCTAAVLAGLAAAWSSQALAVPVAYWRFGDDGTTPADGDWVTPTAGRTTIEVDADPANPPAFIPGFDSTGNGNSLYTWDDNTTGHQYRPHVSSGTVGGNANTWSIQNNGDFPATYTWSQQSSPTVDLQTIAPAQWTIEASVKPTTVGGGFRTFVGREGNGVATVDPNAAPLYLQMTPDGLFRINFTDAAGNNHIATGTSSAIANQWYHVAATSNGSTLSLYVDSFDGTGYQLAATADLTASANSAMIDPGLDANGDTWGWTIGRGRYGTSDDPTQDHGDRFFGYIDEVRISNNAVAPGSFLFAGQNLNPGPRLEVDRDTGEFTLVNMQASIDLVNYSITSASGALNPASWNSIAENQDSDSGMGFDPDDAWTIEVETSGELTETEFAGDGGALGSVKLGNAGAWIESRYEDLQVSIQELLPDGITLRTYPVPVVFSGGAGEPANRSDLDLDGDVDGADWTKFAANHLADLSALTLSAASVFGDLDGDLDNDFADFRLFQGDFDAANGAGALAQLIGAVPEPSTVALALIGACIPLYLRRRRR